MSKSKPSSSSNPWEALFSSATRPQASLAYFPSGDTADSNGGDTHSCNASKSAASAAGGYTILIQHSMTPKSQRQWALASTISTTADHSRSKRSRPSSLTSSIASMTLKNAPTTRRTFQGSWYGISGPFLVRQTFEELCHRCEGAVVFVSLLGTSGVLDFDELDGPNFDQGGYGDNDDYPADNGDDEEDHDGQHNTLRALRRRKNALQMFRRNGACVDLSSDPFGWGEEDTENDNGCNGNPFIQRSSMNKLQPIAMAIRRAAANIETRRPQTCQGPERLNQRKEQTKMQPPIPIVFETATPLLHLHGAEKIGLLIKSLGTLIPSSTIVPPGINRPILSPIVLPILYESLRPSEHRCLEDIADAMIHMNLMDTQGGLSVSAFNEPNSTSVVSGVMDLVRRGGGGRSGVGGKLIRGCAPFHIMRAAPNRTFSTDARDSCYWVLDGDANDDAEEINDKDRQVVSNQSNGSATTSLDAGQPASSTTGPSRPRIYLQDDDPDFVDFDEEDDLDDDIDL